MAENTPEDWYQSFLKLGKTHNFFIEEYGQTTPFPLISLHRGADHVGAPHIYLSAGIHGDEPAGSLALLELLKENAFSLSFSWTLCPLMNPSGLSQKTRENATGHDLNRDYLHPRTPETSSHIAWLERHNFQFDLSLMLHEDWESKGVYLYELNLQSRPSLAPLLIKEASKHCPVETASEIDGFPAKGGIIRPEGSKNRESLFKREEWPEAIYLGLDHSATGLSYTLETPSTLPLNQRVQAHISPLKGVFSHLDQGINA